MATIDDPITSDKVRVNTDGEMTVALASSKDKAGYAVLVGENHNGATGYSGKVRRPARVTADQRLATGIDTPLWEDYFSHATLNTRKYRSTLTTMTAVVNGGFLTLNAGNSVAAAVGAQVRTYKTFPLYAASSTRFHFWFALAVAPQQNNEIQIGLGIPGASATALGTDGVFMVIDSTGNLALNCYFNSSTPTSSGTIPFTFTPNAFYHGEILIHRDRAELYIDDVLLAVVDRDAQAPANAGSLSQTQFGHIVAQLTNTGVPASAQRVMIAGVGVVTQDPALTKKLGALRTSMGDHFLSAPDGAAVAQVANMANSAAPTSATLSNTAAGYTTLGGQFQFAAVAGAETDYALFAFTVPAGTNAIPGKTFNITGVTIDTVNTGAAVATTATVLQWSLGVGSTAVSLATADGAAARAPHRVPLGFQTLPVGAAIGAKAERLMEDFSEVPIPVEPGTILHVILKMPVGTATASQIVRGTVTVKGYWE